MSKNRVCVLAGSLFSVALIALVMPTVAWSQISLYADHWNDNADDNGVVTVYGRGIAETSWNESTLGLYVDMLDPSDGVVSAQYNSGLYYASADVVWWLDPDNSPNGEYETFSQVYFGGLHHGCNRDFDLYERVKARFKYNQQLANGRYEYIRSGANCNHVCEGPRRCHPKQNEWLGMKGWVIGDLAKICFMGQPVLSHHQPECEGPFGSVNVGWVDACDDD